MLTIATLQLNMTVGDIAGNIHKIKQHYHTMASQKVDLIVCPELAITGYPPEDLVLLPHFRQQVMDALSELASITLDGPALLVGTLFIDGPHNYIYNAACLLEHGIHTHTIFKHHLPNYGVFDEQRLFTAGPLPSTFTFKGLRVGILICEDFWFEDTTQHFAQEHTDLMIVVNASPYDYKKPSIRIDLAKKQSAIVNAPIIYVNQVGGQDELVFDGGSFIYDPSHNPPVLQYPYWQESYAIASFNPIKGKLTLTSTIAANTITYSQEEHIYRALVLGVRDYIQKNNFPGILIGMSGGVDSALSAVIAVDAIGPEKVRLIMMPSKYTSKESIEDAKECATALGISLETISIERIVQCYNGQLHTTLDKGNSAIAYENIQSRIRGNILMAISNSSGDMVLTTGNKSEMAVGYATLYGDMCGGFNALKDVYKMQVYRLCEWRNQPHKVIPERILSKAPSAELRENQKDQDSLPEYSVLDDILKLLIEERQSTLEISYLRPSYPYTVIEKVGMLVQRAEYKRRQSAPGIKITPLSFGRDRRFPITSKFKL